MSRVYFELIIQNNRFLFHSCRKHRYIEEKRMIHNENRNIYRDSSDLFFSSKYSVISSPIVYKVGANRATHLLDSISPI